MNIYDVDEWIVVADRDFFSANYLMSAYPKPLEVICYLCAQAIEKYLKSYLVYNDIIPDKTHNLVVLLNQCISIDTSFSTCRNECRIINKFNNKIRYPKSISVTEEETRYVINSTEKIKNLDIFTKIRIEIDNNKK